MENEMDLEPVDERGTKRAADESQIEQPRKPKKIKVSRRVRSMPSILSQPSLSH
ncbi:unnamed protein product [Penicillium salamii]|uniref:Uncharacterized protein n=1 Tax=Penicillium salamii TaxID=1612424 RepID=A0A9W4I8H0_9EURO|nr:unnamed protein product [Penicillium salamii]